MAGWDIQQSKRQFVVSCLWLRPPTAPVHCAVIVFAIAAFFAVAPRLDRGTAAAVATFVAFSPMHAPVR